MLSEVIHYLQHSLNMWSSAAIVLGFSFLVIGMDEFVIKQWRIRHWEKLAASGDVEKLELLRMAKAAHVVEE
jgi:hypothetical protein